MKRAPILIAGLVLLIFLEGCASGPTFTEYAKRIPALTQGEGRIWFYRPGRVFGAAVQPSVELNGRSVGKAKPGGFFHVDRPAGDYEVECTTESTHECRIILAPQSTKYIRFNLMPGLFIGHMVPVEVNAATALVQLQKLHAND